MFIPLGTDRPLSRPILVTYALLGVNVAAFILGLMIRSGSPELFQRVQSLLWLHGDALTPWSFITYQFLHGGFLHIIGNLLVLWVFGPNVEDRLGRFWFLLFYLVGGCAAGALHIAFSDDPVVGASGSIAAVTGAYLVLFPRTIVRVLCLFIIITVFSIPAWWFVAFAIARDFVPLALGVDDRVSQAAHIGGYAFGISVSFILLATRILPRETYDLFSLARQAKRRRDLKSAVLDLESRGPRRPAGADDLQIVDGELPRLRAEVSTLAAKGQLDEASRLYLELAERFGSSPGAALLSRQTHLALANHYYQTARFAPAAATYERFIAGYPSDPELPGVKLLTGLITARHIQGPAAPGRAKQLVTEALQGLHDDDQRRLAQSLLDELDQHPTKAPA